MVVLLLLSGGILGVAPARPTLAVTTPPDFQDTFDGSVVNTSKWGFDYPWDEDNPASCRGGELECYEPQQASVANGVLQLVAKPVAVRTVPPRRDLAHPYASGLLQSQPSRSHHRTGFSTTYGYFEMSARLPNQTGSWPAFWLAPTDTSWPPELDVMEEKGQQPERHSCTYHSVDGTAPQVDDVSGDKSAGFHTYALRWAPDRVDCFFDGRLIGSFTNPPTKSMYIILDLAVGGDAGAPDVAQYPSTFYVDYVRAWRNPNVMPVPPAPSWGCQSVSCGDAGPVRPILPP